MAYSEDEKRVYVVRMFSFPKELEQKSELIGFARRTLGQPTQYLNLSQSETVPRLMLMDRIVVLT